MVLPKVMQDFPDMEKDTKGITMDHNKYLIIEYHSIILYWSYIVQNYTVQVVFEGWSIQYKNGMLVSRLNTIMGIKYLLINMECMCIKTKQMYEILQKSSNNNSLSVALTKNIYVSYKKTSVTYMTVEL